MKWSAPSRSGTSRLLPLEPFTVDLGLAALFTVLALFDAIADEVLAGERAPDAFAFGLILVAGLSLIWRRRAPLIVISIVAVAMVTFWLRQHGAYLAVLGLPSLYSVAVHERNRRRAWIAMVLAITTMMVAAGLTILDSPEGFLYPNAATMAVYLVATAAIGVVVRNRRRIFADAQRRVEEAETAQHARAAQAVYEERARIAREMHDVVAHGMSLIAVQASAAQEVIDTRPEKVVEVLRRIESISHESLTEMRRMLGALRSHGDVDRASLLPQPGLSDLAAVVEESEEAGIDVEMTITGDQRALSPGLELTAYRIVQESLTNVRKHAGLSANARVSIDFGVRTLKVEVSDVGARKPAPKPGAGSGLIGMRERVEIYGGRFSAGPVSTGGWTVRALLPISDSDERATLASGNRSDVGSGA